MTVFIETMRGDLINATDIVRISDEKGATVADLRDGNAVKLGLKLDVVARAACQVLPAQPGFERLSARFGTDEVYFNREPVIGWRIEPLGPEPIVVDDWVSRESEDCMVAVKYPEGQIVMTHDSDYENETEWRAAMEERRKEYMAFRVARAEAVEAAEAASRSAKVPARSAPALAKCSS
jgi:hypothetical protein